MPTTPRRITYAKRKVKRLRPPARRNCKNGHDGGKSRQYGAWLIWRNYIFSPISGQTNTTDAMNSNQEMVMTIAPATMMSRLFR